MASTIELIKAKIQDFIKEEGKKLFVLCLGSNTVDRVFGPYDIYVPDVESCQSSPAFATQAAAAGLKVLVLNIDRSFIQDSIEQPSLENLTIIKYRASIPIKKTDRNLKPGHIDPKIIDLLTQYISQFPEQNCFVLANFTTPLLGLHIADSGCFSAIGQAFDDLRIKIISGYNVESPVIICDNDLIKAYIQDPNTLPQAAQPLVNLCDGIKHNTKEIAEMNGVDKKRLLPCIASVSWSSLHPANYLEKLTAQTRQDQARLDALAAPKIPPAAVKRAPAHGTDIEEILDNRVKDIYRRFPTETYISICKVLQKYFNGNTAKRISEQFQKEEITQPATEEIVALLLPHRENCEIPAFVTATIKDACYVWFRFVTTTKNITIFDLGSALNASGINSAFQKGIEIALTRSLGDKQRPGPSAF